MQYRTIRGVWRPPQRTAVGSDARANELLDAQKQYISSTFGVLSKLPGSEITIDDRNCVAISYPEFWNHLDRAAA